jgi:hypothetical protein
MKGAEIARKMKRTVGAIRTRKSHFKKSLETGLRRG